MTEDLLTRIGQVLLRQRESLNYRLDDVAHYSGISSSHIAKMEKGTANVTLETLALVCLALGLDFDSVLDCPRLPKRPRHHHLPPRDEPRPAPMRMRSSRRVARKTFPRPATARATP